MKSSLKCIILRSFPVLALNQPDTDWIIEVDSYPVMLKTFESYNQRSTSFSQNIEDHNQSSRLGNMLREVVRQMGAIA